MHNDFMLNSFKQMMPFFKSIHDGEKFYIMNFLINLHRRKLQRIKADKIKKIVFSKLWKYVRVLCETSRVVQFKSVEKLL